MSDGIARVSGILTPAAYQRLIAQSPPQESPFRSPAAVPVLRAETCSALPGISPGSAVLASAMPDPFGVARQWWRGGGGVGVRTARGAGCGFAPQPPPRC